MRRAALRSAAHAWPVLPGACLTGPRFACGRPGCPIMRCHPAEESWEDDATTDAARVAHWRRDRPHTALPTTGRRFDALEVPAGIEVPTLRGPVAAVPDGSWFFLVRPGARPRSELDASPDIVRHGRGSWITAAPSRTPDGPVRRVVAPDRVGRRLPYPAEVQVDALARSPAPTNRVAVPRQMSTSRRAA